MEYKVIIAEDEEIERVALRLILYTHIPELRVVAEASNGIELLELCKQETPDFVLLDINMPGISGLDAMEQLVQRYPSVSFIILSAHADFCFAQRALKLGAADYLTKPLKTEALISALKRMIQKLNADAEDSLKAEISEKMQIVRPQIEHNIMRAFLSGKISKDIREQFHYLFSEPEGYFCILVKAPAADHKRFHSVEFLKGAREQMQLLVGNLLIQDTGAAHFMIASMDTEKIRSNTYQYFYELRSFLNMIYEKAGITSIHIYHSQFLTGIDELLGAYKELSQKCMQNQKKSYSSSSSGLSRIFGAEQRLTESILKGDSFMSQQMCEELLFLLKEKSVNDVNILKEYLRDSFNAIQRGVLPKTDTPSYLQELYENFYYTLQEIREISAAETEFANYIMACCEYFQLQTKDSAADVNMEEIEEFIRLNYMEDISLDQIAEKYHISASYLSKHIKNHLGKNYIDYITDLRIKKAKELLVESKKSIKEISVEVGYNSQTYFCKVFKKAVGVNASEYKEWKGERVKKKYLKE